MANTEATREQIGEAIRDIATEMESQEEERIYVASQWQLMWWRFRKHQLALASSVLLILLYFAALFCECLAPYDPHDYRVQYVQAPPQAIRFVGEDGFHLRPFVYALKSERDAVSLARVFEIDKTQRHFIYLFVHGAPYKLWGLFESDLHFFGVEGGSLFLFGTDKLGRDVFSRTLYATRISLTIGLVGVAISFVLGCAVGGISGYFAGTVDTIIQRFIEILISLPTIPLWMALSAALPSNWPPMRMYFGITIILSIFGWAGLARVVRGKLLELRQADFVTAAKLSSVGEGAIIVTHLLPSFMSYLVVNLTLSIPYMILGETALSFLGLGLRPPVVSWGVLLKDAQNVHAILLHPWLLIPGIFVVIAVLAFNFLGDGLRDAADPYK